MHDDEVESEGRPAPDRSAGEIAQEWLRNDGFFNWLIDRGFDPDGLTAKAVLYLTTGYERERSILEAGDQQAERRAAEERERAARLERLRETAADPVRRAGDDPASLRAVAAWRRQYPQIRLEVSDGPAREALETADAALQRDIEAAETHNRDLAREARGEPRMAVVDVRALADEDAVARWLVGHRGRYALEVGRWRVIEHRNEDGEPVSRTLQFENDWSLVNVAGRCAAWAIWAQLNAEAAGPDGEALRAHALKALLPSREVPELLHARIAAEVAAWGFAAARPPEPEQPARPRESGLPGDILTWLEEHPGDGNGAVRSGVKRSNEDVVAALTELERAGRIVNRGTARAKAWHVTDGGQEG